MVLFARVDADEGGAITMDAAARGEAACDSALEVVRRLGLGGGVCLWLPEASLVAGPTDEHKQLLRSARCTVGPFALSQGDEVREWLHAGALRAVFSLQGAAPLDGALSAAIKSAAEGLPAERLVLLLPVGPLADPATLPALLASLDEVGARRGTGCLECDAPETVGVVNGVLLALPAAPGADAAAREAQEDALIEAVAPLARKDRLRVLLGGLHSARPGRGGATKVGMLHEQGIDVVAPATLGPAALSPGAPCGDRLDAGECLGRCARTATQTAPAGVRSITYRVPKVYTKVYRNRKRASGM